MIVYPRLAQVLIIAIDNSEVCGSTSHFGGESMPSCIRNWLIGPSDGCSSALQTAAMAIMEEM
ncbi:hypothetical protein D3C76_1777810 [compost metagenome]